MGENRSIGLSGNRLKMIAAFSMLLDHAGILLFSRVTVMRILGRLAYPIYAFMIAEGCRYTRNKLRYFLMLFGLGVACQIVYYIFSGDTYLNILLTFSLSVALIYLLQKVYQSPTWQKQTLWSVFFATGFLIVYGLNQILTIDYGFWGSVTPVLVSFAQIRKFPNWASAAMLGVGLVLLGAEFGGIQYYALLAPLLLMLYSGHRGKYNMKYFFYIFYPVHLALLQGIKMLMDLR